ncbi:MAG: acyl-CoA dehydrogenase family protein [Ilumatobacteraceae bacterium]
MREVVGRWVLDQVPQPWRDAADRGRAAIRAVRTRQAYEDWYPVFAASGLVVPTWPVAYGGLGLRPAQARVAEGVLAPFNLGRLNPLGLNNAAAPLFAHGTEEQRLRYLPPIVANTERWCQLFSEPGAGSDLASLATRAERDGDEWMLTGQKVWTTWAHESEFGVCLARTDPRAPKRQGITFFIVDLRAPGVEVRELPPPRRRGRLQRGLARRRARP